MDVIATLQKAREIITPPESWCINVRRNHAGAFCALGVIDRVLLDRTGYYGSSSCTPEVLALSAAIPADARKAIEGGHLSDWCNTKPGQLTHREDHAVKVAVYNNTSNHKTVLEWFDRAIELQREHPMEKA